MQISFNNSNTPSQRPGRHLIAFAMLWIFVVVVVGPSVSPGQETLCDPNLVVTATECARCHVGESRIWKTTPHFKTFSELGRMQAAKEICSKLGIRSVKRSGICIDCHFTTQFVNGRVKPVSGVSCESCHGAAKDWLGRHNDFGVNNATRETESRQHAIERLAASAKHGMRNTRDLYAIASSCFNCHTVPNEELVNVGGHQAGSSDFELVRWSQGQLRHHFLRSNGDQNPPTSTERLRVMFVVGIIADLEYSTRATARATHRSPYGIQVAERAASVSMKLHHVQQHINDPNVQSVLDAFADAELRLNNKESLIQIADKIRTAGQAFSRQANGAELASIDPLLPDPKNYK